MNKIRHWIFDTKRSGGAESEEEASGRQVTSVAVSWRGGDDFPGRALSGVHLGARRCTCRLKMWLKDGGVLQSRQPPRSAPS